MKSIRGKSFQFFCEGVSEGNHYYINKVGEIFGFGRNDCNQLSIPNDTSKRLNPVQILKQYTGRVKKIAVGSQHIIVLLNDGQVLSCGYNPNGECGQSKDYTVKAIKKINFFNNRKVLNVYVGHDHTLFLLNDGLYTCGSRDGGRVGFGDKKFNRKCAEPKKIEYDGTVLDVQAGWLFTVILSKMNDLYVSGNLFSISKRSLNFKKINIENVKFKKISAGYEHILAISSDGIVYGGGCSGDGRLSIKKTNVYYGKHDLQVIESLKHKNIIDVKCGYCFSIALSRDTTVYAFGDSKQFGIKKYRRRKSPGEVRKLCTGIYQIKCAMRSVWLFKENGDVWSGGECYYGNMGIGVKKDLVTLQKNHVISQQVKVVYENHICSLQKNLFKKIMTLIYTDVTVILD